MIDASSTIELEEFELIEAAPDTALLRVSARATPQQVGQPLHLIVERAEDLHRLTPLPAPPDPSGMLRIAFTAPLAIVADARFALELPDGSTASLPAPHRARQIIPRQEADPTPEAVAVEQEQQRLRARLLEAEAARQSEHTELLALQETAAEMAAQLDEAETRVEALADVVRRQTAEREAVAEQLDLAERARHQAEATIEALVAELDRLTGRAGAAGALLAEAQEEARLQAFVRSAEERARARALADVVAAGSARASGTR